MADQDHVARLRRIEQDVARLAAEVARLCALAEGESRAVGQSLEALSAAIDRVGRSLHELLAKWEAGQQRIDDRTGRIEKEFVRLQGNVEGLTRRADEADQDRVRLWLAIKEGLETLHRRITSTRTQARQDADGAAGRVEAWLRTYLPYIVLGIAALWLGAARLIASN